MSNKRKKSSSHPFENMCIEFLEESLRFISLVCREILLNIWHGTFPYFRLLCFTVGIFWILKRGWDAYIWLFFEKLHWYPYNTWYTVYFYTCMSLPLLVWAIYRVFKRRFLERKLESIFLTVGFEKSQWNHILSPYLM